MDRHLAPPAGERQLVVRGHRPLSADADHPVVEEGAVQELEGRLVGPLRQVDPGDQGAYGAGLLLDDDGRRPRSGFRFYGRRHFVPSPLRDAPGQAASVLAPTVRAAVQWPGHRRGGGLQSGLTPAADRRDSELRHFEMVFEISNNWPPEGDSDDAAPTRGMNHETRSALRDRCAQALGQAAPVRPARGGAARLPRGDRTDQVGGQSRLQHHLGRRAPLPRGAVALPGARDAAGGVVTDHRADPAGLRGDADPVRVHPPATDRREGGLGRHPLQWPGGVGNRSLDADGAGCLPRRPGAVPRGLGRGHQNRRGHVA